MPNSNRILIIGGGIAGIQGALDAANAGAQVTLVERSPTVGGRMSVLDKNFPTLDCSICIESPKMSEIALNPNIELLTMAEVLEVQGSAGSFRITIRQDARYVTDACTRCGECLNVCPVVVKNEFDFGMAARRAIYTPIEQAVPGPYAIDVQNCLNEPPNLLPCGRCTDVCGPGAIDFDMKSRTIERDAAAIVVATGFDLLDPLLLSEFGYGRHPDILTSMELERLLQASGPSLGEVLRPSDGKHPERVLFVLCAGSRDERLLKYCSRICCMYSIKEAYQLKDHGIREVDVAYMDIRAFGKGFDEFYERTRGSGVRFIRGRPAKATSNGETITVFLENTEESEEKVQRVYDMVVLATAAIPPNGTVSLAKVLGVELGPDGFFATEDKIGDFNASTREGIYLAGCCTGPKDIPDSVIEAGAAVAKALTFVKERSWPKPAEAVQIDTEGEPRIGVFVCHCGSNIAGVIDVKSLLDFAMTLPNVVHAQDQTYSCAANTLNDISSVIRDKRINRVVVAACSPKTHSPTFQGALNRAGLNPYLLDMANIRNMDSWVHKEDRDGALQKAKDMVRMSVLRAINMKELQTMRFPVAQTALVVGGGVAGMVAATNLAEQGFETHLVEKEESLGGLLNSIRDIAPIGLESKTLLDSLRRELQDSGAKVHLGTTVETISGFVGSYDVHLTDGTNFVAGAVVVATGAQPYVPHEFEYGRNPNVVTSLELDAMIDRTTGKNISIISCVGSRNDSSGCSRFCCQTMIDQAIRLKERGNEVNVLYKDIRTFSRFGEEEYERAGELGVRFYQYPQESVPQESIRMTDDELVVKDELSGKDVTLQSDITVLNIGLTRRPPP